MRPEFDPDRARVYFSCGDGTMAIDHKTGKAFLSAAEFGPRPQAAPGSPPPRAPMIPGSFSVLVFGE